MALRMCLGWQDQTCSARTTDTRCPTHKAMQRAAHNAKPRTHRPGYTSAERTRRAEAVRAWRAEYGDWCPGWGQRAPHVVEAPNVLSADHAQAVAAGGAESGALIVRCRSCNSARGTKPN